MEPLFIASRNPGKVDEFRRLLSDLPFSVQSLPDVAGDCPETAGTFEGNAMDKAVFYGRNLDGWVLADDSGLQVDALNGAPGIYSARYAGTHGDDEANNQKLLSELHGIPTPRRTAKFVCALALWSQRRGTGFVVRGTVEGLIACGPNGQGGFGYDPLFYVPSLQKTYAELTMEMKNLHSHRARAVKALVDVWGREIRASLPRE